MFGFCFSISSERIYLHVPKEKNMLDISKDFLLICHRAALAYLTETLLQSHKFSRTRSCHTVTGSHWSCPLTDLLLL